MIEHVVIAGGGQAGFQVALSLRQFGFKGAITIVGEEPFLPYQRPPLSKAYMMGKSSADALSLRPERFYAEQAVRLLSGTRVESIDRRARRVVLGTGEVVGYDHLVLALGARNRPLVLPGAEPDDLFGLRDLADADAISRRLSVCSDVAVVGAGFIGLEFAAVASALGKTVTVFELSDRVMSRAVSAETAAFFAAAHALWGVRLELNRSLVRTEAADGALSSVRTSEGVDVPAGLLLYGIGVRPNVEMAEDCGLEVEDGIKVDAELLTSDAAISAIGDCASFPSPGCGRRVRLESVQNAIDQGRAVAARIVGRSAAFRAVPWFWSDQRDLKLQIAGLPSDAEQFVRVGDAASNSFSTLCFRGDRLIAVESVNRGADHVAARKILAREEAAVTYAQAKSAAFDLRACLPAGA